MLKVGKHFMESKRIQFIKSIKDNYQTIILCLLMFLFGLNFISTIVCNIIIPITIFVYIVVDTIIFKRKQLTPFKITKKHVLYIVVFSIFIFSFPIFSNLHNFSLNSLFKDFYHYAFIPFLFFITSFYFLKFYGIKNLLLCFIFLIFGFFLFSLGCFGNSYSINGIFSSTSRISTNLWNPEAQISVTLLSIYSAPFSIALIGFGFLAIKHRQLVNLILVIILSIFSIIGCAALGNRSFFVILIVGILLITIFFLRSLFKTKKSFVVCACIVFGFLGFVGISFIFIKYNVFGLRKIADKIPVIKRFIEGGSDSNRWASYVNFFKNFYKKPFGGLAYSKLISENSFALVHNTWLDVYSLGGLIPFIAFATLTFLIIIKIISFRKTMRQSYLLLLSTISISIMAGFLFEPVVYANPYLFGSFFMLLPLLFFEKDNPLITGQTEYLITNNTIKSKVKTNKNRVLAR